MGWKKLLFKSKRPSRLLIKVCFEFLAPSAAPGSVSAYNLSSTSIVVTWSRVPDDLLNGILQSYRVMLREASQSSRPKTIMVANASLSVIISSLKKFTVYSVWVAALTVVSGPNSAAVIVSTDEDGKLLLIQHFMDMFSNFLGLLRKCKKTNHGLLKSARSRLKEL